MKIVKQDFNIEILFEELKEEKVEHVQVVEVQTSPKKLNSILVQNENGECGFGDLWLLINYVNIRSDNYDSIYLPSNLYEKGLLVNQVLNIENPVSIVEHKEESKEQFKDIFQGRGATFKATGIVKKTKRNYFKTKNTWSESKKKQGKICVSYKFVCCPDKKRVDDIDVLSEFLDSYEGEVVNVDYPMPLEECIQHLSECSIFVTNESGLSHVANSVGCPTHILTGSNNRKAYRRFQKNDFRMFNSASVLVDHIKCCTLGDIDTSNDVIFFTASGERFMKEAEISIRSILINGDFNGDIILFTDHKQKVNSFLSPYVKRIDSINWEMTARIECLKLLTDYKRILYLDTDIVCINSIDHVFSKHGESEFSLVTENVLLKDWRKSRAYLGRKKFRRVKHNNIINSGTFVTNGRDAIKYHDIWIDCFNNGMLMKNGEYCAQCSLNKMYHEGLGSYNFIGRELVTMMGTENENHRSVFLHWNGCGDQRSILMENRLTTC